MATFIQSSHAKLGVLSHSELKDSGGIGQEVVNYRSKRLDLIKRRGNDEVVVGPNGPKNGNVPLLPVHHLTLKHHKGK